MLVIQYEISSANPLVFGIGWRVAVWSVNLSLFLLNLYVANVPNYVYTSHFAHLFDYLRSPLQIFD